MHPEQPQDNGIPPGATPASKKEGFSIAQMVLLFFAGALSASFIFGAFTIAGAIRYRSSTSDVVYEDEAIVVVQPAIPLLTPVVSSDVNNLRFEASEIGMLSVTTSSGRINVQFHDEDIINIHSSRTAGHQIDGNMLSINGVSGNVTITMPMNALHTLTLITASGRVNVSGDGNDNTVLMQNLYIYTASGNVELKNLAVPEDLFISTASGRITTTNVISDASRTSLLSISGRINTN